MPLQTDFLFAERLPRAQILGQARLVGDCPVLISMLDISQSMVALLNPERQIVYCNEACVRAGGLASKAEALGMRPGELLRCIHAEENPGGCGTSESCRHCGLVQALVAGQQGRANSSECLLQCCDHDKDISSEYAVQVQPLPQLGAGWQCYSLKDISAEKRREALERAFFHDIMNRAGAVEGVSSILAGERLSPQERSEFTGMLAVSAHALVEEVRSQRTLLAAEMGDLAVERTACHSLEALQNAAIACQASGSAESKNLIIRSEAQPILFQTDAALLGRVLINLLKNALEDSDPGMTVTANCTVAEPGRVRFSIHNELVMADHVRPHVFHRSFSTKGAGRGLGTYSIRLLSESYLGGRAWFESATGEGTTFHVEFAC